MPKPGYDPATGKPVYAPVSGKPALDCTSPLCPDLCEDSAPDEYSVGWTGELFNEACEDCNSIVGVPYVLTPGSSICASGVCCWEYIGLPCDLAIILTIDGDTNLVILTILRGVSIEAQWVWDRGASLDCSAATIEANLSFDVADEVNCSGYSALSWVLS